MVTVTSPVSTIRSQATPMAKKVTKPYVPAKYRGGGPSKAASHAWKIADASTHNLDDEVSRSMGASTFSKRYWSTPIYREGDSGIAPTAERLLHGTLGSVKKLGKKF